MDDNGSLTAHLLTVEPQHRAECIDVGLILTKMLTCTLLHFDDVVRVSLVLLDLGFGVM